MLRALRLPSPVQQVRIAPLLVGLFFAGWGAPVAGQYEAAPDPAVWAIPDAMVIHGDGRVDEGTTLVIRNGIIDAMGPEVEVPAGARVVEWDEGGLRVYPGIVDGQADLSLSLPRPDREGLYSWSPTRAAQNVTPHRRAGDYLDVDGRGLRERRRAGVVASVVLPGRGPLPGQASLVLHRRDARSPRELVLAPSLGLAMSFQPSQGFYPSTLMAVQATIRQAFMDAEHHTVRLAAYGEDPRGLGPVSPDEDLELLARAGAGEIPTFFRVSGVGDVRRAIALSDELGLRPVLVGATGAGALAPELARRQIPVLLSAELERPLRWDMEDHGDEDEIEPAAARERARLLQVYRTAAQFEEAGVEFALTSGAEGEVSPVEGARRYVEYGLSQEAAVRALTVTPARLLGVPQLSRIEEGMSATFIVTDRELLAEDVNVIWTFVAGRSERGSDPQVGREPPEEKLDPGALAGPWDGSMEVVGQRVELSLEFEETVEGLSGRVTAPEAGTGPLENLRLEEDRLRFSVSVPEALGTAHFDAALEGGRLRGTGTVSSPDGDIPFTFEFERGPGSGGVR